jgi:hypothetical protein
MNSFHSLSMELMEYVKSDLDSLSFDIEPIILPDTDKIDADTILSEVLVDDLLFCMDHGCRLAKGNAMAPLSSQHSKLSFIETGAPLRSVCPDKRSSAHLRVR